MHERLIAALERSGIAFISSTRLRGRFALRMCVMNFTTRDEDVAATIAFLASEPISPDTTQRTAALGTNLPLDRAWIARPVVTPQGLAALPLFSGLDEDQATCPRGRQRAHVQPGRADDRALGGLARAVRRARGRGNDRPRRAGSTARPGDTIGEIAALEWGAGYGYARTAR